MKIVKERKLRKLDDEEWKEVSGSDGIYWVSNYGRVKSYAYDKVNGRFIKPSLVGGLYMVTLKGKQKHPRHIHRLVALVWLNKPDSDNYTHVLHIDGNARNNYFKNLKWATKQESLLHNSVITKKRNETRTKKQLITISKLKEDDVKVIKQMMAKGIPHITIAQLFRVSSMQITRIKKGENWSHVTI